MFIIRPEQILRQTGIFPPEKEITVIGIGNVGIDLVRFGGEIVKDPIRILFKEIREAVIITDVQQVPVIQSRPLEMLVIQRETIGPYQMQPCPCHRAGPGDIAGIGMNPGFYQHNIEFWHSKFASFCQHCTMLPMQRVLQLLHVPLSYNFQFQSSVKK